MMRLRPAVLFSLLLALALALVACGGSDEKTASSNDVNELLTQTFTGSKKVDSGNLSLGLTLETTGGELEEPVSVQLTGPFQSQGDGELPKFALDAAFDGAGQSLKAGATSTGERGFLSFQGTDYVLDPPVFKQFSAGFEEAQKQRGDENQSFASLGMDPRKWLTDPEIVGDANVGDADTTKITGGVDVAKLLDDVNTALAKAAALGLGAAGQVPEKLTQEQRRKVIAAVKNPRVEIYTGKDDQVLRRMVVDLGVDDQRSGTRATVALDVSITDLNEDQDIAEPADAKPFSELLGQLGGLGLGGAAGGGSSDPAPSGGGSSEELERYSQCITDAGEDVEKARKCSDLLTG
jgi:hypothetical protein